VAVLRLDRPVQYMPHIAPICLPDKGEDFLGHYGWAAGWGALQAGKYNIIYYIIIKLLMNDEIQNFNDNPCCKYHIKHNYYPTVRYPVPGIFRG